MSKLKILALVVALAFTPLAVHAGDSKDKDSDKSKKESKEKEKKSDKSDDDGGFTGFWIHKVGGSIGHGLKSGAHKISSAF